MGKAVSIGMGLAVSLAFGARLDQVALDLPRTLEAVRIPSGDVRIDGNLDDEAWLRTAFIDNFVQRDPLEGEAATERTEFAVLYDDEYIYVAINAYDSDPGAIRSILSRRDERTPSDWVAVSFDSYGDYRTAFDFWLNPQGVKRDARHYDDTNEDLNWDAIWEGKAAIHAKGWSAEFRIPLRELRFSDQGSQTWGLQIYRHISRKNEDLFWTYWPKEESGFVRHYGRLTSLQNIPRQRRIYISPYSTGQFSLASDYITPVHPENYYLRPNLGADLKVGVSNNLTLDVTFNPDFGQIEADPAELNLSAFETFYAEKRPFFIEGSNIFEFGLGLGDGDLGRNRLFYPRRIGRAPQYSSDYDDGYIEAPSATTIMAAGKLSGKTSSGLSIGMLNALTAEERSTVQFTDQAQIHEVVEPRTNYFVTRLQQDLNEGATSVGGIVAAVNRQIHENYLDYLRRDAYSGGLDIQHRFMDDTYQIDATVAVTNVLGSIESMLDTQEGSSHYFQRPDATHLEVDTTATHLTGYTHNLAIQKIKGEHWRGAIGEMSFSPGFEANDLGYHGSVDRSMQFIWAQYREDQPGDIIRNYQLNFNLWSGFTFAGPGEMTALGGNLNHHYTFMNYWRAGYGFNIQAPVLHLTALWGGPAVRTDTGFKFFSYVGSDGRKALSFQIFGYKGTQPDSRINWNGFGPELTWRPTDYFSLHASAEVENMHDTWSTWGDYDVLVDQQTGEERFLLASLDQRTVSATLRIDLTLTSNLSIQFYGSPYVTAGKFFDDKLVIEENVRSDKFDERFHTFTAAERDFDGNPNTYNYDPEGDYTGINFVVPSDRDFNYKQFNSNLVIRWEYQTGSAVYFVWSQNMSEEIENAAFSYTDDLQDLFRLEKENVFMIKASYLFNI